MNIRTRHYLYLAIFLLAFSVAFRHVSAASVKGLKKSDPQLTGARDMNYDHLIVAGERIGPVKLGGLVSDAVQHLGNPSSVFRGPGLGGDLVAYIFKDECISFYWADGGIDPQIEAGRAIGVTCSKWSTPDGLHVGSFMKDVSAHVSRYCASKRDNGSLLIATKEGLWFDAKDRNSPVSTISVMPVLNSWMGMCKDE
jgi:hypothetical protein